MPRGNKLNETVRRYLLGKLAEESAELLEEEYFIDPKLLAKMKAIEQQLIRDFLAGHLPEDDAERFRSRYLTSPDCAGKSRRCNTSIPGQLYSFPRWRLVLTGLAVILFALVPWLFLKGPGKANEAVNKTPVAPPEIEEIHLTPGVSKSGAARQVEFTIRKTGKVRLLLELPGETTVVMCSVEIVKPGAKKPVLVGRTTKTREVDGLQNAELEVGTAELPPDDYIARVRDEGGEILETFSFRVKAEN